MAFLLDLKQMSDDELQSVLDAIPAVMEARAKDSNKVDETARKAELREQAMELISEKVKQAYAIINEAEALSDESGVPFNFSLCYGMGGTYEPKSDPDWSSSDCYGSDREAGWVSSSEQC